MKLKITPDLFVQSGIKFKEKARIHPEVFVLDFSFKPEIYLPVIKQILLLQSLVAFLECTLK